MQAAGRGLRSGGPAAASANRTAASRSRRLAGADETPRRWVRGWQALEHNVLHPTRRWCASCLTGPTPLSRRGRPRALARLASPCRNDQAPHEAAGAGASREPPAVRARPVPGAAREGVSRGGRAPMWGGAGHARGGLPVASAAHHVTPRLTSSSSLHGVPACTRAAQACVPPCSQSCCRMLSPVRRGPHRRVQPCKGWVLHCMHADSEGAGPRAADFCRKGRGLSVHASTRRRPEGPSSAGVGVYVYGADEYFRCCWERIRGLPPA